ncbi:galactose ABC transporter substrate-binding protein [Clostridium tertium]|nr:MULTISPECIES: galactose ABC transporter substrate-binding protein [Clostridium]MDB1922241.1 galactose ABC transporter substrate-binding protein [Clostridium tertium]MDB1926698.1 galactose ABC transporter substrate-binding protein [Clostridium tertium]MDB1929908.1 galactose ABC transporter substrate-binding protein [Clostridium tertium]MDU2157272.1 galactose ABC transporter substrate-binding protein [Clostridium sp.]MDU7947708.1 galactose ABC transporter substrate-binding protein [Clostridiu
MKKLSLFSIIIIIIIIIMNILSLDINAEIININPIRVGVLLYKEDDYYISELRNHLLKIENENKEKIDFIFYDADANQELQNRQIDELIKGKVDLILLNIVDIHEADSVINKIKENNIPLILFNREPLSLNEIKSYNKSLYVGTESCDAGKIKSEMIINEIKSGNIKDKNENGSLDYILLEGEQDNIEAQLRSECVIRSLNENKIKTNEIANEVCNWSKECAKKEIESLFSKYGDNIEVIISNNDEMAIGAILALQEKGYNIGDPDKFISVVGVDGTTEARKMIKNGFMTGTVLHDAEAKAKALYRIGLNLVEGKEPLQDTEYKFDETGVGVRIPYNGYITRN